MAAGSEAAYGRLAQELEEGYYEETAWQKACEESGGDQEKARLIYQRLRVAALSQVAAPASGARSAPRSPASLAIPASVLLPVSSPLKLRDSSLLTPPPLVQPQPLGLEKGLSGANGRRGLWLSLGAGVLLCALGLGLGIKFMHRGHATPQLAAPGVAPAASATTGSLVSKATQAPPNSARPTAAPTPSVPSEPSTTPAQPSSPPEDVSEAAQMKERRHISVPRLEQMAQQEDKYAQFRLYQCYLWGQGVSRDVPEAMKWLQVAANHGEPEAESALGRHFADGYGIKADQGVAVHWATNGARHGSATAAFWLALHDEMLMDGRSHPDEVAGWLQRASELGYPRAAQRLARLYGEGKYLPASREAADKWAKRAQEQLEPYTTDLSSRVADHCWDAWLEMGYCRREGLEHDASAQEAAEWFTKGAQAGDPWSQRELGRCYYSGYGVAKDAAKAFDWYLKAAGQGNIFAASFLGAAYDRGRGVAQNPHAAVRWYRVAAEQGLVSSQHSLGLCAFQGRGMERSYEEALQWFTRAAKAGYMEAQLWAGDCWMYGKGAVKDEAKGYEWYRKAGEQGSALGQLAVGWCYTDGTGITKDPAEAVKWFRRSAMQGNAKAENRMGYVYYNGLGVTMDKTEAVKWYRKAADQGLALAQWNLGTAYRDFEHLQDAATWFRKAAELGLPAAQYDLGCCCYRGQGMARDPHEAMNWWYQAAKQGHAASEYELALGFLEGDGVAPNYVESYRWASLSVAGGYARGNEVLQKLASLMTSDQIAQGQALAQNGGTAPAPPPSAPSPDSPSPPSTRGPAGKKGKSEGQVFFGTGFFITSDGYMVTNHHVVKDGQTIEILVKDAKLPARLVKADSQHDLALLKVEGSFKCLPVGDSERMRLGDTVVTVGFPMPDVQGSLPKYSKGEISSLGGLRDDDTRFQISVPLQHGNSGGPLVDEHGSVVGVTSSMLSAVKVLKASGAVPQNVNYAVKSRYILDMVDSVPEVKSKLQEEDQGTSAGRDLAAKVEAAVGLIMVTGG